MTDWCKCIVCSVYMAEAESQDHFGSFEHYKLAMADTSGVPRHIFKCAPPLFCELTIVPLTECPAPHIVQREYQHYYTDSLRFNIGTETGLLHSSIESKVETKAESKEENNKKASVEESEESKEENSDSENYSPQNSPLNRSQELAQHSPRAIYYAPHVAEQMDGYAFTDLKSAFDEILQKSVDVNTQSAFDTSLESEESEESEEMPDLEPQYVATNTYVNTTNVNVADETDETLTENKPYESEDVDDSLIQFVMAESAKEFEELEKVAAVVDTGDVKEEIKQVDEQVKETVDENTQTTDSDNLDKQMLDAWINTPIDPATEARVHTIMLAGKIASENNHPRITEEDIAAAKLIKAVDSESSINARELTKVITGNFTEDITENLTEKQATESSQSTIYITRDELSRKELEESVLGKLITEYTEKIAIDLAQINERIAKLGSNIYYKPQIGDFRKIMDLHQSIVNNLDGTITFSTISKLGSLYGTQSALREILGKMEMIGSTNTANGVYAASF